VITARVTSLQLSSHAGCADICVELADLDANVQDPRQVTFWFVDALRGSLGRPHFLGTGKVRYSKGKAPFFFCLDGS
jgi:hypothetical protein